MMSITNNIAEGSGSVSDADFANFLNMARRSCFESANIMFLLGRDGIVAADLVESLNGALEEESRMLLAFMRTLKRR